jgi:hypothetical protein
LDDGKLTLCTILIVSEISVPISDLITHPFC